MTNLNEDKIRELYHDKGLSMRAISKELEVPLATLSRFMKKYGISSRSKAQAQKNFLRENNHQMSGHKHSSDTKEKISKGLGEFWDGLTDEQTEEIKHKMGSAWKKKWASMNDNQRRSTMENLSNKAKEAAGQGSKLERFIAGELKNRGYTVEERSVNYTAGKSFEVDIALPKERIAIEVDGPTHFIPVYGEEHLEQQQDRDARKDENILSTGYSVLRIRDNNGACSRLRIDRIEEAIKEIMQDKTPSVWYIE